MINIKTYILVLVILLLFINPINLEKVRTVEQILTQEVRSGKTPSVHYVFFNSEKVLYEFNTGFIELSNRLKADRYTTYNIYSITKTLTAISILQLVEQGKIDLDSSVRKYLPDSSLSEKITVKHLLTHTSGLGNPLPINWIHLTEEHSTFNRNAFFESIIKKYGITGNEPGDKFKYTNLGYIVLGQVIEAVTGVSFEEYVTEHIIHPLALKPEEMGFSIHHSELHATGYHDRYSLTMLFLSFFLNKSKYMDKSIGKWKPFKQLYVNGAPYGGLIANVNSFVKYGQTLLSDNNVLISNEAKMLMFTENKTNNGKSTGMCLSWFRGSLNGNTYYTHAGGGGGYYCELRLYPELKAGSFVVFNRSGFSDERFLDKLDKYMFDKIK